MHNDVGQIAITAREPKLIALFVAAAGYIGLLCLIYFDTLVSMVDTWLHSETFTHGFLIAPLSLWLVWRSRHRLILSQLTPSAWFALAAIVASLVWLVAALVDVQVVMQYAFVAMLVVGVGAIFGKHFVKVYAFPLGFLFLSVPAGMGLEPPMMDLTAHYTVKLIQLTGIPVYQEGRFFELPSGSWSVVEACSGVRYLIASFTLGLIYAHLSFTSLLRKTLFIVASILVPIVANILRAYGIVMLGHFSGMTLATGVDHLIYGWIFFGFVMLVLFHLGGRWSDIDERAPAADTGATPRDADNSSIARSPARLIIVCLFVLAASSIGPVIAHQIEKNALDSRLRQLPELRKGGEQCIAASTAEWTPTQLDHVETDQFLCPGDRTIQLTVQQFLRQEQGDEIVAYASRLKGKDREWRIIAERAETVRPTGDLAVQVKESVLRSKFTGASVFVWSWYRIGSSTVFSPAEVKVLEALNKLVGEPRASVEVFLSRSLAVSSEDQTRQDFRRFLQENPALLSPSDDENDW